MKEEKVLNMKFIIMAIICICLFVIAIVPKELQNDTFYTIKLGELILDNGIDTADTESTVRNDYFSLLISCEPHLRIMENHGKEHVL